MPLRNKSLSHIDPLLLKALKDFPHLVKKQHAAMRKNQNVINRISKAVIKEFKLKGINQT